VNFARLRQEIWQSPYYRLHPIRTARLLHAKHTFSQHRLQEPLRLLTNWGLDISGVLNDLRKWTSEFDSMFDRIAAADGDQGGVSRTDGMVLYAAVRALRPEYIIETGVAAGLSTAFLAAALVDNGAGQLISIELPPVEVQEKRQADGALFSWPQTGIAWAMPHALKEQIGARHTLILEDVRSVLPGLLNRLPGLDMFLHDDLHQPDHMLWEYQLAWQYLRPGGLLISDDVNSGWLQFCRAQRLPLSACANVQRLAIARKPENG